MITPSFISTHLFLSNIFFYIEYPLRCLIFNSQVICGMWRRNGSSAINLSYNYNRSPLCRTMRDMDILALQLCLASINPYLQQPSNPSLNLSSSIKDFSSTLLSSISSATSSSSSSSSYFSSFYNNKIDSAELMTFDMFLCTLIYRYNIHDILQYIYHRIITTSTINKVILSISSQRDMEYMPSLLSELLKQLIVLITYVPVNLIPLSSSVASSSSTSSESLPREGWQSALKRHVFHHILSGVSNTGMMIWFNCYL